MELSVATPHRLLSVDEYLEMEQESSVRHEYVGGELYAFAGANRRHNQLVMNIAARLWAAARSGPCQVFTNDMKLRAADDVFYYPDVMVVCDPEDTHQLYSTRPCLVVEVLSPSTESIDRREKLLAYRRMESLQAYIVVYQDEVRAVRHWRDEHGVWWQAEVSREGLVTFPRPELELSLAEIYEGIDPPGS